MSDSENSDGSVSLGNESEYSATEIDGDASDVSGVISSDTESVKGTPLREKKAKKKKLVPKPSTPAPLKTGKGKYGATCSGSPKPEKKKQAPVPLYRVETMAQVMNHPTLNVSGKPNLKVRPVLTKHQTLESSLSIPVCAAVKANTIAPLGSKKPNVIVAEVIKVGKRGDKTTGMQYVALTYDPETADSDEAPLAHMLSSAQEAKIVAARLHNGLDSTVAAGLNKKGMIKMIKQTPLFEKAGAAALTAYAQDADADAFSNTLGLSRSDVDKVFDMPNNTLFIAKTKAKLAPTPKAPAAAPEPAPATSQKRPRCDEDGPAAKRPTITLNVSFPADADPMLITSVINSVHASCCCTSDNSCA